MTDAVSVVIPTYYRNNRLREAIRSARQQTHSPWEILVVDDADEPHAKSVVTDFADVEYVHCNREGGVNAARNLGLERTEGDVVQFLDDDDRLLPAKFERQLELLDASTGVVYGPLIDETTQERYFPFGAEGPFLEFALRIRGGAMIPSTMLIDRAILEAVAPLPHHPASADVTLRIELARRTECGHVSNPVCVKGTPEDSISHSPAAIRVERQILGTYSTLYATHPAARHDAIRYVESRAASMALNEQLWALDAIRARWRIARSAREGSKDIALLAATLLGRPGLAIGQSLWSRLSQRRA